MTSTTLIIAVLIVPVLILIALVLAMAAVVHCLSARHGPALLISQRVEPRVILAVLGHLSITMTMDTYGHVLPEVMKDAADAVDPARCGRSGPWCCAWHARTPAGDIGECMANCSRSGSRSPRRRCGRSCARPGWIPRPTEPPPPGQTSCAPKPRRRWPRTSSKRRGRPA